MPVMAFLPECTSIIISAVKKPLPARCCTWN